MHRRALRVLIASLVLSSYVLISPVFAHANLESSSPAADELVTTWPNEVVLKFNEDLITTGEQQVNFVSVTDAAGVQIDLMDSAASGNLVTVSLPEATEPGSYFVNYRVVSADGHVVEDSYEFIYDAVEEPVAISADQSDQEPEATPYVSNEEEVQSSSNLGLILGLVTIASFILLVMQFRKNRYK